jgi:urea transport system ATP-binding protein
MPSVGGLRCAHPPYARVSPLLSVEAVDLYYGASHALRRVSLTAQKGEVTCILGRNGVGKTSLLRAIFGLQPIRSGEIRWEDRELTDLRPHERARAGLAMVPQGREIFPRLSVLENLATGFATLPRSLRHIPDDIFALFPILKDMLHRRGGDLSGGQQQQLAIARALVARPRLLILDEPTEGIQPSIIKEIGRVIERLAARGDMAILLVEQYFEFARDLAAAYVVMQRGEIVLSGRQNEMDETAVRGYLTV